MLLLCIEVTDHENKGARGKGYRAQKIDISISSVKKLQDYARTSEGKN